MQNKKDNKEPGSQHILSGLVNIIQKSLDHVNNLQSFVIAIVTLIVLLILGLAFAPYLPDKLQAILNIIYIALVIIFILAVLVIRVENPQKISSRRRIPMDKEQEQYQTLRKCMERLTEPQFREMIISLLTPEMQDGLTVPIIKGSFLGDMRRWGNLDKVEKYLRNNLPESFIGQ